MKVSVTFNVGDGDRKAFAWYIDRKQWDGKRKATRDEIAGVLRAGAEETYLDVQHQFEIQRESRR